LSRSDLGAVPSIGRDGRGLALASSVALLLAVGLAAATYRYPPPSAELTLLAGVGLTAVLLLAIARYDVAVALGFLLLGIVVVEPAPADLVFTVVIVVAAVTGRFQAARVQVGVALTLAAFVAVNALSVVDAVDPDRAAFFISVTLYLVVFGLWLSGYVDSSRRAKLVVVTYVWTALASAALGILALLTELPGQELLNLRSDRATALFQDPNVFGPFMAPAALIMLEETLQPRLLRLRRSLKLVVLSVLAFGVLFSFSRGAWLGFAVSVLVFVGVYALRRERAARMAVIALVVVLIGALAGGVLAVTGWSDFLQERARAQTYDAQRFDAQASGLDLALTHPVGIGPGQFEPVVQYAAHSTYIRVFSEQGALGLLAFMILALITLWLGARNVALGKSTYGIGSAALLAAWCGLLVNSLFVDTLHWRHLWVVGALIWAGSLRPVTSQARAQPLRVGLKTTREAVLGETRESQPAPEPTPEPEAAPEESELASEAPGPTLEELEVTTGRASEEGKVSLNRGTFGEFRGLGMSVTQAMRVLRYRDKLGGYHSVDDLDKVPGFPGAQLAEVKKQLTI
jgi:hypothetical protein